MCWRLLDFWKLFPQIYPSVILKAMIQKNQFFEVFLCLLLFKLKKKKLFFFLRQASLCSSEWPGTHYEDQADLKVTKFICLCFLGAGKKCLLSAPKPCFMRLKSQACPSWATVLNYCDLSNNRTLFLTDLKAGTSKIQMHPYSASFS